MLDHLAHPEEMVQLEKQEIVVRMEHQVALAVPEIVVKQVQLVTKVMLVRLVTLGYRENAEIRD